MKKIKIPSSMIIVFICLLIVSALTWVVPTSVVVEENGVKEIIYNAAFDESGGVINNAGTNPAGLWDIFLAPIIGFFNAGDVSASILVSGSLLGILNYVGALDAGIGKLLKKFTGKALIAILILVFALMGTVYGAWEELPAYAMVILPLFVVAGYDTMTGLAVLFVGATIGNMTSIVNPYSTGAAVSAIGNDALSLGSGIQLRVVLFLVLYIVATFRVIRYAEKVRKDKTLSIVSDIPVGGILKNTENKQLPELTRKRFWSLVTFLGVITLLVMGYVPWFEIPAGDGKTMYDVINAPIIYLQNTSVFGDLLGVDNFTLFGDWYFREFSTTFLIGTIIIAMINRLSLDEFSEQFTKGAMDLLGVVLVLGLAKGITEIMGSNTSGMSITFVYWIQEVLQGVPTAVFAIAAILAYVGIGFVLQSTSSVAGITMPILGAVAMALFTQTEIGAVGGQIILISAFTLGINFMSGIYPGPTIMGSLELAKVPYDRFLKFMLGQLIPLLIIASVILSISPYIGLV